MGNVSKSLNQINQVWNNQMTELNENQYKSTNQNIEDTLKSFKPEPSVVETSKMDLSEIQEENGI